MTNSVQLDTKAVTASDECTTSIVGGSVVLAILSIRFEYDNFASGCMCQALVAMVMHTQGLHWLVMIT